MDGDHQAVAETIEDVAVVALDEQSRIDHFFARKALVFEGVFERVPVVGRITELEGLNCFRRDRTFG